LVSVRGGSFGMVESSISLPPGLALTHTFEWESDGHIGFVVVCFCYLSFVRLPLYNTEDFTGQNFGRRRTSEAHQVAAAALQA